MPSHSCVQSARTHFANSRPLSLDSPDRSSSSANRSRHASKGQRNALAAAIAMALPLMSGALVAVPVAAAELEEVLVTAQIRAESLQDVPISVIAVAGDRVQDMGIGRLEDLSTYVPNMTIREGFAGEILSIRGFGSNQNPSFEQAVSTFIDGVYFGRAKQSLASLLDLERVEVLRGPQSTFFGNSAIAGALNLTTVRPGNEFESRIRGIYNPDDDEIDINGGIGGPISDTFGARVAFKYLDSDGWLDNTSGGRIPQKESTVLRTSFVWDPNDNLEVFLKLEYGDEETVGATNQIRDCGPNSIYTPAPSPGRENAGNGLCDLATTLTGHEFFFDDTVEKGGLNPQTVIPIPDGNINSILAQEGGEFRNIETQNANLTFNWTMSNDWTVTSITGFTGYDSERQFDIDSTPLASISANRFEEFEQFSQEFRIASPGGEAVDWLAGLYLQSNEVDFQYFTYTLIDTPDGSDPGGPPGGNGVHGPLLGYFSGDYEESNDTVAAFASATWNLTDRTRVTVGLRYSEVEKDGDSVLSLGLTGNQEAVPSESAGAAVPFIGSPAGPAFIAHAVQDTVSSEELTGQINVQYDLTESMMVYGTIANGFKAGGFDNLFRLPEVYPSGIGLCGANDPRPPCGSKNPAGIEGAATGGSFSFDQEEVVAYEVGFKAEWESVRLNLALFQNEFDDLQQSIFNPTALAFQIKNAGAATSRGLELDMQWAASDNLTISVAGALLDASYDEFEGASCDRLSTNAGEASCDLSGEDLPQAPGWSATLIADHVLPLNGSYEVRSNLTAVLTDGYRSGVELDDRFQVDSYELIDARVELWNVDAGWSVGVWGRNLTDELIPGDSNYGAVRSVGPFMSTTLRPMSWGISFNYNI